MREIAISIRQVGHFGNVTEPSCGVCGPECVIKSPSVGCAIRTSARTERIAGLDDPGAGNMHPVAATGSREFAMAAAGFLPEKFPIGKLAASSGVGIETIRYYERIKLLAPPARTQNGRRLYGPADLRALAFIRRSRELGFSLDEIRALLHLAGPAASCRQVREIAAPRLDDIRARLRDLRKMERVLESTLSRCSGKDVPECPILDVLDIERARG
jgi:MerR family mercuric resistance operon transcriptional regulator